MNTRNKTSTVIGWLLAVPIVAFWVYVYLVRDWFPWGWWW